MHAAQSLIKSLPLAEIPYFCLQVAWKGVVAADDAQDADLLRALDAVFLETFNVLT